MHFPFFGLTCYSHISIYIFGLTPLLQPLLLFTSMYIWMCIIIIWNPPSMMFHIYLDVSNIISGFPPFMTFPVNHIYLEVSNNRFRIPPYMICSIHSLLSGCV